MSLQKEIEAAISRHSAESGSNVPGHVLAEYLVACIDALNNATRAHAEAMEWRLTVEDLASAWLSYWAVPLDPGASFPEDAGCSIQDMYDAQGLCMNPNDGDPHCE